MGIGNTFKNLVNKGKNLAAAGAMLVPTMNAAANNNGGGGPGFMVRAGYAKQSFTQSFQPAPIIQTIEHKPGYPVTTVQTFSEQDKRYNVGLYRAEAGYETWITGRKNTRIVCGQPVRPAGAFAVKVGAASTGDNVRWTEADAAVYGGFSMPVIKHGRGHASGFWTGRAGLGVSTLSIQDRGLAEEGTQALSTFTGKVKNQSAVLDFNTQFKVATNRRATNFAVLSAGATVPVGAYGGYGQRDPSGYVEARYHFGDKDGSLGVFGRYTAGGGVRNAMGESASANDPGRFSRFDFGLHANF